MARFYIFVNIYSIYVVEHALVSYNCHVKVNVLMPCNLNRNVGIREKEEKLKLYQNPINSRNYMGVEKYPIGFIPHQINFGCKTPPEYLNLKEIIELKKLVDLPCLYCGEKMVPTKIFDELKLLPGEDWTRKAINLIKPFEDALLPPHRKVFKEVEAVLSNSPELSFHEAIMKLRHQHIGPLRGEETKVLRDIFEIASGLPKAQKDKVENEIIKAMDKIKNEDIQEAPFKRKAFIKALSKIEPNSKSRKLMDRIQEKAQELPTSQDSANAFIVKYSPISDLLPDRSDMEIVQSLIGSASVTVEHIHTQEACKKENNLAEINDIKNLALAHQICNRERDNTNLRLFLEQHQITAETAQKQMDYIIESINSGILKGCDDYPQKLKETLFKETGGLINLNISKLILPIRDAIGTVTKELALVV